MGKRKRKQNGLVQANKWCKYAPEMGHSIFLKESTRALGILFEKKVATGERGWVEASACLVQSFNFLVEDPYEDPDKADLRDYVAAVLMDAWREALLKEPETILELGGKISFGWTCGYPYRSYKGDFDETHTIEWADDYLEQGLAALARVDNEYL